MRKFVALMVAVIIAVFSMGVLSESAHTAAYQDRYLIAFHTYDNTVPQKYNAIYRDIRDRSAKRTMIDAARDACLNSGIQNPRFYGPNSKRPFDCATDFRR